MQQTEASTACIIILYYKMLGILSNSNSPFLIGYLVFFSSSRFAFGRHITRICYRNVNGKVYTCSCTNRTKEELFSVSTVNDALN